MRHIYAVRQCCPLFLAVCFAVVLLFGATSHGDIVRFSTSFEFDLYDATLIQTFGPYTGSAGFDLDTGDVPNLVDNRDVIPAIPISFYTVSPQPRDGFTLDETNVTARISFSDSNTLEVEQISFKGADGLNPVLNLQIDFDRFVITGDPGLISGASLDVEQFGPNRSSLTSSVTLNVSTIPEPSSLAILGIGSFATLIRRRRSGNRSVLTSGANVRCY